MKKELKNLEMNTKLKFKMKKEILKNNMIT